MMEELNLDAMSLEDALDALERITSMMEEDEMSLEESFRTYQKGMELVSLCKNKIDSVEKQLIVLQSEAK